MAVIHPLGKDACVVVVSARTRVTFRRGALEMLLFPEGGRRVTRVPLERGRDDENGDVTLSKTGRTLLVRVIEPPRLFICKADLARDFLRGRLGAVPLIDASDDDAGAPAPPEPEEATARTERLADLARRTRERLGGA